VVALVCEFVAPADKPREFDHSHAGAGRWAQRFRKTNGYPVTMGLCDPDGTLRYFTIDRSDSAVRRPTCAGGLLRDPRNSIARATGSTGVVESLRVLEEV